MKRFDRHDLTHISLAGRERIFAELLGLGHRESIVGEMLLPERFANDRGIKAVPGIVRREELAPRPGFLPVGFASWRSGENGRLRVASFALPEEVIAKVSPEDVASKMADAPGRTLALAALRDLRDSWRFAALRLGVWGSTALEIETGHPYTHQWSDLDVRILPTAPIVRDELKQCLAIVRKVEKKHGVRIDAELLALGGYGISLKELLSGGATALGKGLKDVALVQKTDVFAGLAGNRRPDNTCETSTPTA